jgi:tRNA A37 N6-isopentenylltransferase MiaA
VSERIDPEAYQQRLDRISEIFSSMQQTVDDLSTRRCPYKNRHDRCTAQFGCRNQRKPPEDSADRRFICGGDDKLDYRSAWEVP